MKRNKIVNNEQNRQQLKLIQKILIVTLEMKFELSKCWNFLHAIELTFVLFSFYNVHIKVLDSSLTSNSAQELPKARLGFG